MSLLCIQNSEFRLINVVDKPDFPSLCLDWVFLSRGLSFICLLNVTFAVLSIAPDHSYFETYLCSPACVLFLLASSEQKLPWNPARWSLQSTEQGGAEDGYLSVFTFTYSGSLQAILNQLLTTFSVLIPVVSCYSKCGLRLCLKGIIQKCRLSGPTRDLPNQNLQSEIPGLFIVWKSEDCWAQPFSMLAAHTANTWGASKTTSPETPLSNDSHLTFGLSINI